MEDGPTMTEEDLKTIVSVSHEEGVLEDEEKEIKYTDVTGMLMSSVKTIVDSVSYVLIAFVAVSLIVSFPFSTIPGVIIYLGLSYKDNTSNAFKNPFIFEL